ncbi:MAG TPA: zinc ribbon domain-containing protein [Thermoanaerobaculia bacterium]|nr:zinc ribbon domain-containing protein [Thermoanaerobaculia bacterium]
MSREEIPGDLVKLCPQCGSEYQLQMERCLDCDTPLVHGVEGQGAAIGVPDEASHDIRTYPQDCVHLRTAPPRWIGRLSEDLDEAGIRHWVAAPEWRRDPSLWVLPADLEAAKVIDRERYAMEMPEVWTEPEDARPQRPARRLDASAYDSETKVCPSCGGEYQLWAETCADCGVPLVRPWDLDSARENEPRVAAAPVPVQAGDSKACPACGERVPEGADECPGCGLTLAQPEACPNCGAELSPYASGCRLCGFELFGSVED